MTTVSRRAFLKTAAGSTVAASLSSQAWVGQALAARQAIAAAPLGGNLLLFTGAGSNVIATGGPDGALLVDGGLAQHSASLLKAVLKQTGTRRVHTLINTHWHPEQTGSNERLGKSGARIIAHENTRLWLTRKIAVSWRDESYGPLPAKALPTDTTYTTGELAWGEEQIEYGYMLQAHTDGDLYVKFRQANVLAAGGVVAGDAWPVVDYETGGWIAGLIGGLNRLIKLSDENTRIVPASGPVLTRKDLETQRAMYNKIYERLVKSLTSGLGPEEALTLAPAREFEAQFGDSREFVTLAFKSLWGHIAPDA